MANRVNIGPKGSKLDWDNWGKPVTDAINDYENRIALLESEQTLASYTLNGTMATSSGAEVAMTAYTGGVSENFVLSNGYTYRIEITCGVGNTDAAGTTASSVIRLRKGINTTSGQQLLYTKHISRGGSDIDTVSAHGYIKNASGVDVTTQIGVTIARNTGTANNLLYGDVNIPLIVELTRMGPTAKLGAGITAVAVSIV